MKRNCFLFYNAGMKKNKLKRSKYKSKAVIITDHGQLITFITYG